MNPELRQPRIGKLGDKTDRNVRQRFVRFSGSDKRELEVFRQGMARPNKSIDLKGNLPGVPRNSVSAKREKVPVDGPFALRTALSIGQ